MMAALSTDWTPKGVRGNAIAPTMPFTSSAEYNKTRDPEHINRLLSRIKLGRFAKPEDNFDAALFLASPAADFVSGQTLFVDGGWNAV
jgi:NAD(P)-dependent dehydrogenase (short-subunit alcohol dehydrogenase family)